MTDWTVHTTVTTPGGTMSTVEYQWRKDFASVAAAIPTSWILADDYGSFIDPSRSADSRVMLYRKLRTVGYAKGWM